MVPNMLVLQFILSSHYFWFFHWINNMVSEFNDLPDPIPFGKHRSCYANYTDLTDFKSDCKTTTKNRKSTRRSSSGKKYCTTIAWHTTCRSLTKMVNAQSSLLFQLLLHLKSGDGKGKKEMKESERERERKCRDGETKTLLTWSKVKECDNNN